MMIYFFYMLIFNFVKVFRLCLSNVMPILPFFIFYLLSRALLVAFRQSMVVKNIFGNTLWQKLTKGQPFFVNKSFQRND